jgi:hypothetical protein
MMKLDGEMGMRFGGPGLSIQVRIKSYKNTTYIRTEIVVDKVYVIIVC